MTDRAKLERGYRRLLAWYPRAFRREYGPEIVAVLMACARDGQRRFVLQPRGLLAAQDDDAARYLTAISRMIAASPALLAREREVLARYTGSLATLLAEDTAAEPGDLRPWVVAHALMGTHQSLIEFVRRRVLAEPADHRHLAAEVSARGREALALLEQGLASYGARPARLDETAGPRQHALQ